MPLRALGELCGKNVPLNCPRGEVSSPIKSSPFVSFVNFVVKTSPSYPFALLRSSMNHNPLHIMSVVGARPNFMKIAPFVREIGRYPDRFRHTLVGWPYSGTDCGMPA